MSTPEKVQLCFACATLPVALTFVWLFARDLWWKTWFGRSLMAIAIAIVLATLTTILFRVYGPGYFGRSVMIVASGALTFFAMVARTAVLWHAQVTERRSRRATEHRH